MKSVNRSSESEKRIVVLGAGESGTGAAILAKAKGMDVFVSDMGAISPVYQALLDQHQIAWESGKHTPELILNADEVPVFRKSVGKQGKIRQIRQSLPQNFPVNVRVGISVYGQGAPLHVSNIVDNNRLTRVQRLPSV